MWDGERIEPRSRLNYPYGFSIGNRLRFLAQEARTSYVLKSGFSNHSLVYVTKYYSIKHFGIQ